MKTSVNAGSAKTCPTCARPLPAGAPAGLCPACLLAQGAETETGAGGPRTHFVPPPLPEIAALFPQLEILRLLGAGGMGAVYQARQPALDRFVALKVLPAEADGGASFSERFNREARALARLSHPNIVTVHEFGQAGRLHYFLMEFVDGANLRQLEQASRLSPREALQLIPQICDALQYAHDEGVVHRDIKPENVLVDRKGRVKIADFGLAKILGHDPEATRLTVEGQVMGTPHYMAPEQVERPLTVDHRADIYALGVVFYEMLTGDLPLGKFAPPSRKVSVDVRLDEIVLRALENDPARRYQQASEVKTRVADVTGSPEATVRTSDEPDSPGGGRVLRWAGIPVVVERNGEREVSFNGALGVVAAVLMTTAAGLFAIQWTTGREHYSPKLCFFIAGWTAFLAIRSTLRRKDPTPKMAANGTVILPPRPRFPYGRDLLMLAGLFAVVVGSHYFKTGIMDTRLGIRALNPPIVAKADSATGVMTARLPGGGTVELLAVADAETAPNQWWRPDGTPETAASYTVPNPGRMDSPGKAQKDFVFRFAGLPQGADGPFLSTVRESDSFGSTWGAGDVALNGQPAAGLSHGRIACSPDLRRVSLVAGFCLAPWQTIGTYDRSAQFTRMSYPPDGPRWNFTFHDPSGSGSSIWVTYIVGPDTPLWKKRLVAVDQDGREHTSRTASATPSGSDTVWSERFEEISLEKITEFRLQVRPVESVVFEKVALRPAAPLPPARPLQFQDMLELTFDELIDFDTGRTAAFPMAVPAANPFASIGENILWAQERGFDAVAGRSELQVADADFAPLTNADWETLSAQEVINRLHRGLFHPRTLKELRPGEFPATYAYRTREQGYGMIQLAAFDPERPGATVRLKRVVRPGENPRGSGILTPAASPAAALELRPVVPPDDTFSPFELLPTAAGQSIRVAKNPWLRGDAFAGASWRMDPVSNTRVIVLRLSDSGRREFARLSAEHVREQVALVLAGRILFAPQIAAPMDVATLEVGGLDRERGTFLELLAALNPLPAAAGPIRFGEEHEAVLLKGGRGVFHWYNLAESRAMTVAGTDRSAREYHEARRGTGGDLEALGGNPMPLLSGHDLTVVPFAGDGPPPTALEVAYRWELQHQEPEPENLLSTGTYALRTRRGFTGILEVLGWAQDQTGVRIRYREVLNSNAAP